MANTATTENSTASASGFDARAFLNRVLKGDVALGIGILGILVMLLLPMPRMLLDMSLAISISVSVLVLMTGWGREPDRNADAAAFDLSVAKPLDLHSVRRVVGEALDLLDRRRGMRAEG